MNGGCKGDAPGDAIDEVAVAIGRAFGEIVDAAPDAVGPAVECDRWSALAELFGQRFDADDEIEIVPCGRDDRWLPHHHRLAGQAGAEAGQLRVDLRAMQGQHVIDGGLAGRD